MLRSFAILWLVSACATAGDPPLSPPARAVLPGMHATAARAPEPAPASTPAPPVATPCPEEMVFVDTMHCPDTAQHKVGLQCLKKEEERSNKLTICHRFAPGQTCRTEERRQRFCIDRYEYPSVAGAHPPVMVSAYDAASLCAEKNKRLCWESEWTAACEGPQKKPFPYGHERSKAQCNIDNPFVDPNLSRVHSPSASERDPELRRLDQSVASGSMSGCRSDFGVFDLTGNLDEWVLSEWPRGKSEWAALKGGAWGHVRNACRPVTVSHSPQWSYYFVSFRCCKDVSGDEQAWKPPAAPVFQKAVQRGWSGE
ncbi:MAG TPA: SUMF1/EgtB/PvdO family nonheme iron enzyme [Polyangiaceae bacterium]|jgi:hypothetical protein|nr:SUMF1/EgtB/PvdO family nonheme iron enzyme [Polyangiaceae bacterium]